MTGVCINYKYFFKYSDDNLMETQDWNLDVHFLDKGGIHRKPNNFGFHTIGLDDLKGMFSVGAKLKWRVCRCDIDKYN